MNRYSKRDQRRTQYAVEQQLQDSNAKARDPWCRLGGWSNHLSQSRSTYQLPQRGAVRTALAFQPFRYQLGGALLVHIIFPGGLEEELMGTWTRCAA